MIAARIRKTYPARPDSAAFTLDLEFEAAAGVTVLFGPSGAGKTLTLDAIAGFVRPDQGRVLLDGEILFDGATGVHLPPQARHCGYVFQNYALFPHMTLRKNLEFAVEQKPRLERHRRVNEMLERFRLTDAAGRRPHEVSGGQRQRCSIARAIIGAPKLLLLDEPAQGLDAVLRAELYEVLRQVRADFQTPVLLVTHDLDECFGLGEEMLILHSGRVVQSGPPRKILDHPTNLEVARLLGAFNLLAGEIKLLDPGRNLSRILLCGVEIEGPYFPGRLKGDRVTVCVRPEQLTVASRGARTGPNQIPADLTRTVEKPQWVRLEFVNSAGEPLAVDLTRAEYERQRENAAWVVEFPRDMIRVV
ncbi:MAG TPA: ABC transporter ATP-binding protein [Bryobacteraceae bacterium]|nr:ABC transporter ATP-binding protein [Bryobacteraceae bacterium]